MATDVQCQLEADDESGLVRLTGVLDATGVETVHDALLTRLADRCGPVAVDVGRLRMVGPAGRELFDRLCREVADWPAAEILIYGSSTVSAGLGRAVWPSRAEALARMPADDAAVGLSIALAPTVGAAREARRLVDTGCTGWQVPELVEAGCIAVTEMVNNVVAHAGTTMTVRLALHAGALRVAVRDHSRQQPHYAGLAPLTSTGGRGLLLIDNVARRWGSTTLPDGKMVWAVLAGADETSHRPLA